jgi:hypothetical protein
MGEFYRRSGRSEEQENFPNLRAEILALFCPRAAVTVIVKDTYTKGEVLPKSALFFVV